MTDKKGIHWFRLDLSDTRKRVLAAFKSISG